VEPTAYHSASFVGVILLLLALAFGIPVAAYILDRKDSI